MRFKGYHRDKKRITYKEERDGFQADALCQDEFIYQVFMHNGPAPTNISTKVYHLFTWGWCLCSIV
eukprot:1155713-Ditylum_brightwellii.AAC.2